ncbi:hypothetical protein BDR04DRAFT_1120623 [Suillus decipiens]|nr:hypothetical protein BDR04DRAFT_1120623 [Suillus decipiens]
MTQQTNSGDASHTTDAEMARDHGACIKMCLSSLLDRAGIMTGSLVRLSTKIVTSKTTGRHPVKHQAFERQLKRRHSPNLIRPDNRTRKSTYPDLRKNLRYEGLFNPTRSRKRRLYNSNNTAGLQQDVNPSPNPVHGSFGNQLQPGISHLILTLRVLFTLVLHQRVTMMQIFELARQCRRARTCRQGIDSIQQPISNTSTIMMILDDTAVFTIFEPCVMRAHTGQSLKTVENESRLCRGVTGRGKIVQIRGGDTDLLWAGMMVWHKARWDLTHLNSTS